MDYVKMGIKILDKVIKVIKKEVLGNNDKEKRKPMKKILVEIAIIMIEVVIVFTKKKQK